MNIFLKLLLLCGIPTFQAMMGMSPNLATLNRAKIVLKHILPDTSSSPLAYCGTSNEDPLTQEEDIIDAKGNKAGTLQLFLRHQNGRLSFKVILIDISGVQLGYCEGQINQIKETDDTYAWIESLQVVREHRGKGYGTYLVGFATKALITLGCKHVEGAAWAHDLPEGKSHSKAQKRLLKFYTTLGAHQVHSQIMQYDLK